MKPESFEKLFYATFGQMLAKARRRQHVSQEMLAEELGLSRTSITNMEKGRQPVQLHTVYTIARFLSTDLKELLPSPIHATQPNTAQSLSVSRSEWLEQMNVKLTEGANDAKTQGPRTRSKKLAG